MTVKKRWQENRYYKGNNYMNIRDSGAEHKDYTLPEASDERAELIWSIWKTDASLTNTLGNLGKLLGQCN